MTSIVTVILPARFTAELRGRRALDLLRRAQVPHLFDYRPPSGGAPCWTCPASRVPDVLAAAQLSKNLRVVLRQQQEALPL